MGSKLSHSCFCESDLYMAILLHAKTITTKEPAREEKQERLAVLVAGGKETRRIPSKMSWQLHLTGMHGPHSMAELKLPTRSE